MKRIKLLSVLLVFSMVASLLVGTQIASADDDIDAKINKIVENMETDEKIGQKIMQQFRKWKDTGKAEASFTTYSAEVGQVIQDYHLGGVILFGSGHNYKNKTQNATLNYNLQQAAIENNGIPILQAVDQEGGIVTRFLDGTSAPGNMALGATGDTRNAYDMGSVIGSEVAALGYNVDFAPTLDVNNNPSNPVINLRSFGDDPQKVANYGVQYIKGVQSQGVLTAAKHFPGHGDTASDSHYGFVTVDKTKDELWKNEFIPFKAAVDNGVDMIMTAHIVYSAYDDEKPATISRNVITGLLREEMAYKGVVVTDAMEMKGLKKYFTEKGLDPEVAPTIATFAAGVDIALMPVTVESLDEAATKYGKLYDAIKAELEKPDGVLKMDDINASVKRILKLKYERGILQFDANGNIDNSQYNYAEAAAVSKATSIVASAEHRQTEREIAAKAATIVSDKDQVLPLESNGKKVLLIGRSDETNNLMKWAMNRLNTEGATNVTFDTLNFNVDDWDLEKHKSTIDQYDYVIVLSYLSNVSYLSESNKTNYVVKRPQEITAYTKSKGIPSVIMSIYLPYDVAVYPDADAVIAVYGYRGLNSADSVENFNPTWQYGANIPAGLEVIFGVSRATGTLPVNVYTVDPKSDTPIDTSTIVYPNGHGLSNDTSKSYLKAVIDRANEEKAKAGFDSLSDTLKDAFNAALDNAQTVHDDAYVSQDQVDQALINLLEQVQSLNTYKANKDDLEFIIEIAESIDLDLFSDDGKEEFTDALAYAKEIFDKADASEFEIYNAGKGLLSAMANLQGLVDFSGLWDAIAMAGEIDDSLYTEESLATLEEALDAGLKVAINMFSTQEEVDTAESNIRTAYANLVLLDEESGGSSVTNNSSSSVTPTKPKTSPRTGDIMPLAIVFFLGAAVVLVNLKKRRS